MKTLKELRSLVLGMVLWAVGMIVAGVVLRINWELFLIGWSAL